MEARDEIDSLESRLLDLLSEPPNFWARLRQKILQPQRRDPEFRKAVGVIHEELREIGRLRGKMDEGLSEEARRLFDELLRRDLGRLTVDEAWELAESLQLVLPQLGDPEYVG